MTSKEMERKALEQIKKIVADLGEDSYIGMAFDGCFEIAEENIENDWGCSMKERAERAEADMDYTEIKYKELLDKFNAEKKRNEEIGKVIDQHAARIDELEAKLNEANQNAKKSMFDAADAGERLKVKDAILKDKNMEIVKLKAKLYDLLIGSVA